MNVSEILAKYPLPADLRAQLSAELAEIGRAAGRYMFLRNRDLNTIREGGVFAGMTPDNVVLNGADLDGAIDGIMEFERPVCPFCDGMGCAICGCSGEAPVLALVDAAMTKGK